MLSEEWASYGLDFRVLGPFTVSQNGGVVTVGGAQLRTVLARLLVDAGRLVSVSALVDELWGERRPADAERTARTYMSRLRAALRPAPGPGGPPAAPGDPGPFLTHPSGYELRVDPSTLDAVRFERLAGSGRRALDQGQPRLAAAQLTEALALWQGDAYSEVGEGPVVSAEGARLNGVRLGVVEDRIAAASASGLDAALVEELEGLVRAHPLRERLWGLLMVALYRSGRQAEALAAYRNARAVLVETHGVEPSPELSGLHQRILNHDPSLVPAPRSESLRLTGSGDTAARIHLMPVPAQLPSGGGAFVGRRAELAQLDAVLAHPPRGTSVTICAITGTAGVGKTSLAVNWAHRVSARFPDGQLYVNLRGFAASDAALAAGVALRGFLEAFGLPPGQIPDSLDARAALFRSVLAGKRVLVVLDNARDAHHVRPLLPGTPGSMVVVTSRSNLAGMVAAEGAHQVVLDVMTDREARELLAGRLGWDRVAAAPAEIDEIIAHCARLPLALAIAPARPDATPARLAAELRAAAGGLDAFELGDGSTSVRAVLSWSYRLLSEPSARLFRLLGRHRGSTITTTAVAGLARLSLREVRSCLRELLDASLLTEPVHGQYRCHHLLRAYAAECESRGLPAFAG